MIFLEAFIVLGFIFLGARLGGIGIGLAGGAGIFVLANFFGVPTSESLIPIDVILVIIAVITAIATLEVAGGLSYLVSLAKKFLEAYPKRITIFAPIVAYLMTLLTGTGHTVFAILPIIANLSKEQGVRPSRPLSITVVASQIAITASPISAALVAFAAMLKPLGVSYLAILAICIPSTFIGVLVGALVASFQGVELVNDPIYQKKLKAGLVNRKNESTMKIPDKAKCATFCFFIAIIIIVFYAAAISPYWGVIQTPMLGRSEAILTLMLMTSLIIVIITDIDITLIPKAVTFQSGMTACVCILGVAWLGSTWVNAHIDEIKIIAGESLLHYPWLLAVVLFFSSILLYSQGATTVAMMPIALSLGIEPVIAIASFFAVSALFILPTYPPLLAAVQLDETGSTRIGQYVINHPFILPGLTTLITTMLLGFMLGHSVLNKS